MNGQSIAQHDRPHIIIADDDPSVRFLLKHILEKERYITHDAANGMEVLTLLEQNHIDMVLLDAVMPELNGFEACRKIKERYADIPTIIITSLDDDNSVEEAFNAGADDYITKPINWSVLKHRISRAHHNTPASIIRDATNLATDIENNEYRVSIRYRLSIDYEQPVTQLVQFNQLEAKNKRLLSPDTPLQLRHARILIERACKQFKNDNKTDRLAIYIQPFNANPVQFVSMLRDTLRSEKISEAQVECVFSESQLYRKDYEHLYNAVSELNTRMHIERFSFSLHVLNIIKNSRCDAIEIDIPLTYISLNNSNNISIMLEAYKNRNITIIGADISTPKELEFAKQIGCTEFHGPSIGNDIN